MHPGDVHRETKRKVQDQIVFRKKSPESKTRTARELPYFPLPGGSVTPDDRKGHQGEPGTMQSSRLITQNSTPNICQVKLYRGETPFQRGFCASYFTSSPSRSS
jgi:hypothetical protein